MDKTRLEKAVLRGGGFARAEAPAWAINAEPWEPRHGEAAVPRELAVTRAELIAELAASSPHLRVEDAVLSVATVFDQITAALARGERVGCVGLAPSR